MTTTTDRATDINYGLKIERDTDFYRTSILVDSATGFRATFKPKLTNKGWTVVLVIGSKKTGRTEYEVGISSTYTMHQAQDVAATLKRDTFNRLYA